MIEPPASAYFRPKHGRWVGEYRFTTENLRALLVGSAGWSDKVAFLGVSVLTRLFGALRIETRVDASAVEHGTVYHTTRISKWGVPLQASEEWFAVAPDGRTFEVSGALRMAPLWWLARPYRGSSGEVDEAGSRASYRLAWAGAALRQRSAPDGDALRFEQETDGCRGSFVLRRLV